MSVMPDVCMHLRLVYGPYLHREDAELVGNRARETLDQEQ